ncbi:hypothetical protein TCAL_14817 [Tigriopus californicus]|uniref:Uncharacterized protein n=1 Tax=Tigriopus californicus TaxID=6832 RepID=A0A553PPG2_TIGCA|nr:hypothetical protein TCAL_14817 [Tigriopus californicus]
MAKSAQFARKVAKQDLGVPKCDSVVGRIACKLCMICFLKINPGSDHHCNVANVVTNLKTLVPSRVLQIAAQDNASKNLAAINPSFNGGSTNITTIQLATRGRGATWVKLDQDLKKALNRKRSMISIESLDNIRLEAEMSCNKIKIVAQHLRKSARVEPHFAKHLVQENNKYQDFFRVVDLVMDQDHSIITVICTNAHDFLISILEERKVRKEDVLLRLSIDEGKGFLKITSSLVLLNETMAHFKSGGVKRTQILALSPSKESYDTIKTFLIGFLLFIYFRHAQRECCRGCLNRNTPSPSSQAGSASVTTSIQGFGDGDSFVTIDLCSENSPSPQERN